MAEKKIHKVESQYKNPDSYINRLKAEISWLKSGARADARKIEDLHNQVDELKLSAFGKYWFQYGEDVTNGVTFVGTDLVKRAKLGLTVWLKGRIVKFVNSDKAGECGATFAIKDVYLKD